MLVYKRVSSFNLLKHHKEKPETKNTQTCTRHKSYLMKRSYIRSRFLYFSSEAIIDVGIGQFENSLKFLLPKIQQL